LKKDFKNIKLHTFLKFLRLPSDHEELQKKHNLMIVILGYANIYQIIILNYNNFLNIGV